MQRAAAPAESPQKSTAAHDCIAKSGSCGDVQPKGWWAPIVCAEEKWEAISDRDAFFSRVYDHFNQRGLRCILAARIINLLTLVFTGAFTVFLFDVMNWHGLLYECVDDAWAPRLQSSS